jgi:hypothetical protein
MAVSPSPTLVATPALAAILLSLDTLCLRLFLAQVGDYSDDEDNDLTPRSYCKVLRSGSPFFPSGGDGPPLPAPQGCEMAPTCAHGRQRSDILQRGRVCCPLAWRPPQVVWRPLRVAWRYPPAAWVPGSMSPNRSVILEGMLKLPALWIRDELSPDLVGCCFNCLRPADHISKDCIYETNAVRKGTTPATAL